MTDAINPDAAGGGSNETLLVGSWAATAQPVVNDGREWAISLLERAYRSPCHQITMHEGDEELLCAGYEILAEAVPHGAERPEPGSTWALLEAVVAERLGVPAVRIEHFSDLEDVCFMMVTVVDATLDAPADERAEKTGVPAMAAATAS